MVELYIRHNYVGLLTIERKVVLDQEEKTVIRTRWGRGFPFAVFPLLEKRTKSELLYVSDAHTRKW